MSAGDPCMGRHRQGPWANAHRIPLEQDKPAEEQGSYLHPDLYGESEQKRIGSAYSPCADNARAVSLNGSTRGTNSAFTLSPREATARARPAHRSQPG